MFILTNANVAEIQALKIWLTWAKLVAAGGIGGSEGSVVLVIGAEPDVKGCLRRIHQSRGRFPQKVVQEMPLYVNSRNAGGGTPLWAANRSLEDRGFNHDGDKWFRIGVQAMEIRNCCHQSSFGLKGRRGPEPG
jgi:hypothetical protein